MRIVEAEHIQNLFQNRRAPSAVVPGRKQGV